MSSRSLSVCLLASLWAMPAWALEISTGFLIGPKYDSRAFYVRANPSSPWRKTYSGAEFRRQAQGKLVGIRLSQALYRDDFLKEAPFDPDRNTEAAVALLPWLQAHGVNLVSVDLQGADPRYAQAGIARLDGFRHGPDKGSSVSAYNADGSLRADWMTRLDRFLRAANEREIVVELVLFSFSQDELFDSSGDILAATRNLTLWLIEKGHRNVILSPASDWSKAGWDHDSFVPQHLEQIIDAVRDCFQARHTDYALPVVLTSGVRLAETSRLVDSADILMVRGDGLGMNFKKIERPEVITELTGATWEETPQNLAKDAGACAAAVDAHSGWLSRPLSLTHVFPFRYSLDTSDPATVYFRGVLNAIAGVTLSRPPRPAETAIK